MRSLWLPESSSWVNQQSCLFNDLLQHLIWAGQFWFPSVENEERTPVLPMLLLFVSSQYPFSASYVDFHTAEACWENRPGPWQNPLIPNASVFREPRTSSKFWEKGNDIGFACGAGQGYNPPLQSRCEPMGCSAWPDAHGSSWIPFQQLPYSLGPSLIKVSSLSWAGF